MPFCGKILTLKTLQKSDSEDHECHSILIRNVNNEKVPHQRFFADIEKISFRVT